MASGAALRARAISASRSIRYCATGAMAGYFVAGSWVAARRDAATPTRQTNPETMAMTAVRPFVCMFISITPLYRVSSHARLECALVGGSQLRDHRALRHRRPEVEGA